MYESSFTPSAHSYFVKFDCTGGPDEPRLEPRRDEEELRIGALAQTKRMDDKAWPRKENPRGKNRIRIVQRFQSHESIPQSKETQRLISKWFHHLDINGSGKIGYQELLEPFISVGIAHCAQDVRDLIEDIDTAGAEAGICLEEFTAMMNKLGLFKNKHAGESRARVHAPGPLP